jgi:hypothetical protein
MFDWFEFVMGCMTGMAGTLLVWLIWPFEDDDGIYP